LRVAGIGEGNFILGKMNAEFAPLMFASRAVGMSGVIFPAFLILRHTGVVFPIQQGTIGLQVGNAGNVGADRG